MDISRVRCLGGTSGTNRAQSCEDVTGKRVIAKLQRSKKATDSQWTLMLTEKRLRICDKLLQRYQQNSEFDFSLLIEVAATQWREGVWFEV